MLITFPPRNNFHIAIQLRNIIIIMNIRGYSPNGISQNPITEERKKREKTAFNRVFVGIKVSRLRGWKVCESLRVMHSLRCTSTPSSAVRACTPRNCRDVALNSSRARFRRQVSPSRSVLFSRARHCRKNPETSRIRIDMLRESLEYSRVRREYIDDHRYQVGMTNELFGVYITRRTK